MAVTNFRIEPRAAITLEKLARRGARWLAFLARCDQGEQPAPADESDQAETEGSEQ